MSKTRRLARARRILRSIRSYARLQSNLARAGVISPGQTWRKTYEAVNAMLAEWCDKALKESRARKTRKARTA
jgi:hypothetical protein